MNAFNFKLRVDGSPNITPTSKWLKPITSLISISWLPKLNLLLNQTINTSMIHVSFHALKMPKPHLIKDIKLMPHHPLLWWDCHLISHFKTTMQMWEMVMVAQSAYIYIYIYICLEVKNAHQGDSSGVGLLCLKRKD